MCYYCSMSQSTVTIAFAVIFILVHFRLRACRRRGVRSQKYAAGLIVAIVKSIVDIVPSNQQSLSTGDNM